MSAVRTFILRITSWTDLDAWRELELTENHTLHDLHEAIQEVFELDDDHLYTFFLNDRIWDQVYDYGGPRVKHASHEATRTRLGTLPLRRNKRVLYLFDFGDELLHEVRVMGEAEAAPEVRYPRLVASHGDAPQQYFQWEEQHEHSCTNHLSHDPEGPKASSPETQRRLEDVAKLVPSLERCLEAFSQRAARDRRRGRPEKEPSASERSAAAERDAAQALLDASGGDYAIIHEGAEHQLGCSVNPWLAGLPRHLSDMGLLDDASRLGEQLVDVVLGPQLVRDMPLILARAQRGEEARRQLVQNIDDNPDEPQVLLVAAEASLLLRDLEQAETYARRALEWSGSQLEQRRDAVDLLAKIFEAQGRADQIAAIRQEEKHLRKRLADKERGQMFGSSPRTFERAGAKVGRNDPCPCGSGKKYKKCCA